jgi:hypothetical protein
MAGSTYSRGDRDSRNAIGSRRRQRREPRHAAPPNCLRTFLNSAAITLLSPERGEDDAITGWIATCRDGQTVALASYYFALPGRIDTLLSHVPARETAPDKPKSEASPPCPSNNCCCA